MACYTRIESVKGVPFSLNMGVAFFRSFCVFLSRERFSLAEFLLLCFSLVCCFVFACFVCVRGLV